MISDIENSLLVKYLKNELSEEESQKVIGWLEQNKENQEFLFWFEGSIYAWTMGRIIQKSGYSSWLGEVIWNYQEAASK